MIDLNDKSLENIKYFPEHNAPILDLNAYVEKQLVATYSNDCIRIFNIIDKTLNMWIDVYRESNNIHFSTQENVFKIIWNKFGFTYANMSDNLCTTNVTEYLRLKTSPSPDIIIQQNRERIKEPCDMLIIYLQYYLITKQFLM
ncbi:unnamed protein product [Rotaria sp. Silwood2]|nr:unnamed protein product [Rotaria sp. Silwood2]